MSDILFLSVKEHANKLVKNEGFSSTTGDLATLTASSGKDMYLARAKVVFYTNNTVNTTGDEVVLKVNGTVIETVKHSSGIANTGISGGNGVFAYSFENIGHSVAATQVIKLEVITLGSDTDVEGFVECFEETTGESPWQPSEFP